MNLENNLVTKFEDPRIREQEFSNFQDSKKHKFFLFIKFDFICFER